MVYMIFEFPSNIILQRYKMGKILSSDLVINNSLLAACHRSLTGCSSKLHSSHRLTCIARSLRVLHLARLHLGRRQLVQNPRACFKITCLPVRKRWLWHHLKLGIVRYWQAWREGPRLRTLEMDELLPRRDDYPRWLHLPVPPRHTF